MIRLNHLARKAAAPLVATGLAVAAVPASAMTATPIPATEQAPAVTLVSGGCGIYAHRTVYGFCRPNFVGYRYGYGVRGWGAGPYYGGYGWHRGWGWRRGWY